MIETSQSLNNYNTKLDLNYPIEMRLNFNFHISLNHKISQHLFYITRQFGAESL